ncbi:MAG TPA: sigma-70 family RNA polymerase sigma factor [Planctomycetota bacterium]|nr:sigma-70 family RNA polymerase sigma factor [Planctomycetota bacterium]
MTDGELLARYTGQGSQQYFAELVRRHSDAVYACCLRILGNQHDAEDAAQATFLLLVRKARALPRDVSLGGWLFWAASHCALTLKRSLARQGRHDREASMERVQTQAPPEPALAEELRPHLDLALAALPASERDVTVLRFYYGKTEEEIGQEVGCARRTVSLRLANAMEKLLRSLSRQGVALSASALAAGLGQGLAIKAPAGLVASVQAVCAGQAAASPAVLSLTKGAVKTMIWAKLKLAVTVVGAVLMMGGGGALIARLAAGEPAGPQAPESARIKAAPANTWVKLAEETDGARDVPLFCYAPNIGKFILAGGVAGKPQHFDTELFDAGAEKWTNAHPKDGPYKNESGLTDAPSSGYTGWPTAPFQTDKAGVSRIRMDGETAAYETDTRMGFQYAFDPVGGKLYTYFFDITAAYDPAERKWTDLKADRFSKTSKGLALIYGSLAYDPVNKEILSVGGTSNEPGGTPGTWAFNIAAGAWKKVEAGSKELRALGTEAEGLRAKINALANAVRNRFYVTESEGESKENLAERAGKLAAEIETFAGKLKAAKLAGPEEKSPPAAAEEAGKLAAALKALGGKLGTKVGQEALAGAQAAQDLAWRAARALDAEPCGRGYAQMATDPAAGKIVLFGGSRLDGFLADTWVYDCKSRSWEQRRPKACPTPRAGHTLAWLPKSGAIVLAGGASRRDAPPQDLWTYDLKTDSWKLLAQLKDGPAGGPGAADTADQLIVVSNDPKKHRARVTWGMRVDPAAAGVAVAGGPAPETVVFGLAPADYDKVSQPDPEAVGKFLKELPANTWKLMPKPPKGTATRDWGTLPYDTDRHQILHWGGGHSSYVSTDLAHYSLRTATWSLGYPAEDPPTRGFFHMANQSFNNRPHVPNHVWDAAAYDPASKKGVWMVRGGTWTYDPASREWDYPPAASIGGELKVALASTPRGVVCWGNDALQLFDAKAGSWTKLPLTGGKVGGAYGDTSGMCYDSKRDCLWLGHNGDPMMRYDLAGGALTIIPGKGRPGCFMRETVYVPEIDMLLNEIRVQGDGAAGNLAYDIEGQKWVGLNLPYEGKEQYISTREYWATTGSRSLHYDPLFKVAVFYYRDQEVGVARLDKPGLKTFEVKLQEPKK